VPLSPYQIDESNIRFVFKVDPRCANTLPSWIVSPKSSVLIFESRGWKKRNADGRLCNRRCQNHPRKPAKTPHAFEGNTLIGLYDRELNRDDGV
jgi:hypothetical protein